MVRIPFEKMRRRTIELPTWLFDEDVLHRLITTLENVRAESDDPEKYADQDLLALADLKALLASRGTTRYSATPDGFQEH